MQIETLTIVTGIILVTVCVFFIIFFVNLITLQRLQQHKEKTIGNSPCVSILVPARDEAESIEACVRSLIAQDYEALEVLVLNDQSNDETAKIVQRIYDELAPEQQQRLRLLQGRPLPSGWVGKNYACSQLVQQAQGDVFLFTDADTVHAPGMTRSVIACMQKLNVSLLTAQPEYVLGSLGELLVVPLLNFTILTLLPVALIRLRPESSLATGNGQLLCFARSTYEAIGGHEAVKEHILEDVLLARATKTAGYRMALVDASRLVQCRMYRSFTEVWTGFSKNLFALYNASLVFALCSLVLNLLLFVAPPLLIILSPFITLPALVLAYAYGAYVLTVLIRYILFLRFTHVQRGLALLLSLLHPISILLQCLILLNSIRWHYRKAGVYWKGREYAL